MIITNRTRTYGSATLESFKGSDDYERKEKWSRAKPFEMTKASLDSKLVELAVYDGAVYDGNGDKTGKYTEFKNKKVYALWFVDGCKYRPSADDYDKWDGHILLDLDKLSSANSKMIYGLLAGNMPEWAELLKHSGSGSIHILCKTQVTAEQKTKRNFQIAFDTFSILLNNLLDENGLKTVKPDSAPRNITQCMALWKTEYVLNEDNTFNVFDTTEYSEAEQAYQVQEQKQKALDIMNNNEHKIKNTGSAEFKFVYDTKDAVQRLWQPDGLDHASYEYRFPIVVALYTLGVDENETYHLCQYGFRAEDMDEVRRYYGTAKTQGYDVYTERNLNLLKDYLQSCNIQYSIKPIIKVDAAIRPLNEINYNETINLERNEYLMGNFIKECQMMKLLRKTDKDIIYIYSAPSTGKTEMVKWLMTKEGKRVCYICGRNTVLEGKFHGMDVTRCYGKYAKDADLEDKSKSLIASLNWFVANANDVLTGGFDYVIADEIHLADEAFRKEVMISLLRIIEKFNTKSGTKLILMTGTPSIEVNYLNKERTCFVKVVKEGLFPYDITPVIASNYATAVEIMIEDVKRWVGENRKAFIVENDTKRNAVLTDYLNNSGIRLVDFNRKNKTSEEVRYVVEKARIPDGYDGIILTSYMGVGNEIKDNHKWQVFFLPSPINNFKSNEIEQFAKRIRHKSLSARIYYYGSSLASNFIDREKALEDKGSLTHKKYQELLKIKDIEEFDDVRNIIDIRKAEDRYMLYTYQSDLYERGACTVLSLLNSEYGWQVNECEDYPQTVNDLLSESRKRITEVERERFVQAVKDMYMRYAFTDAATEDKPNEPLRRIACGLDDYEESTQIEGEDIFSMRLVKQYLFYSDYHRQLAKDVLDFGGEALCAYQMAIDPNSNVTLLDVRRVLNAKRLYDKFGDKAPMLFKSISTHLHSSRYPFNRNTLTREHKAQLVAYISSLFPTKPMAVSTDIANLVVALGYRDKGSGSLQFDLVDFYAEGSILLCLERLEQGKVERIRQQKREYKRRRKE